MNEIAVFTNEQFGQLRTVEKDSQPWFVAADVCKMLGLGSTATAVKRIDSENVSKTAIRTVGGIQDLTIVDKDGLMQLILASRKPTKNETKKWLMNTVFPKLGVEWTLAASDSTISTSPDLRIFNHPQFGGVRIKSMNGDPWFVAADVCKILSLADTSQAMERIDDSDKRVFHGIRTANNTLSAWCVNESGLYSLIFESTKPEAKQFKRWVTHDVIPAIRKHGAYLTPELTEQVLSDPDTIIRLATDLKNERSARIQAEQKILSDAPKVLFADSVSNASNEILVGELAKLLNQNGMDIGQNRLYELMRKDGYIMKNTTTPTQYAMDRGWFRVIERTVVDPGGSTRITKTTKVTGKGQVYFINKYLDHNKPTQCSML